MVNDEITISENDCKIYADSDPEYLLIRPFADHDENELDEEVKRLRNKVGTPFLLAAFKVGYWNQELTPWEADTPLGNESFGAEAKDTLAYVENDLIPEVLKRYPAAEKLPVILGGYSLAGLFCLWAGYESDHFSLIAACSPSVWYPGWIEYAGEHAPRTKKVYLSLGKKEEKTKNKLMGTVGDCIRKQHEIFANIEGMSVTLEWNEGNHFADVPERMAKGFAWCMGKK